MYNYSAELKTVLPFAGDFESAHVAANYPYGRLRTEMRFWVEYRRGQGFRAVTCSLNPKTGKWNKPHKDTYTEAIACYLDLNGHIKFAGFSHYERESAGEFFTLFESGLENEGKKIVKFWEFVNIESQVVKKELNVDSLYGVSGAAKMVEGKALNDLSKWVKDNIK